MSAHCGDCGADLVYVGEYPLMECEVCRMREALERIVVYCEATVTPLPLWATSLAAIARTGLRASDRGLVGAQPDNDSEVGALRQRAPETREGQS